MRPLDAEADRLCGAQRYERNEERRDTRAGSYQAGGVNLKVRKLRSLPFDRALQTPGVERGRGAGGDVSGGSERVSPSE